MYNSMKIYSTIFCSFLFDLWKEILEYMHFFDVAGQLTLRGLTYPWGEVVSFPDPPLRDGTRCEAEGLEDLARIIAEIVRIVSRDWDYNYLISVSNILNHGFF